MINWSKIPSLSTLRAFEAVGRFQNQSEAAASLNVTQAAISQQLRTLEDTLDEKLFQRQGKGIVLTQTGRKLHAALQSGFGTIAQGIDDIRDLKEKRPIRVTMTPVFAENWLLARIGSFWQDYPNIQVELIPTESNINLEEVDLAIRHGTGSWPNIFHHGVIPMHGVLFASPEYIQNHKHLPLTEWDWIIQAGESVQRRLRTSLEVLENPKKLKIFATTTLAKSAVLNGYGATFLNYDTIEPELKSGQVEIIKSINFGDQHGYHLISQKKHVNKNLQAFVRWLLSQKSA